MSSSSSLAGLQTAKEIAGFLQVSDRAVYLWAKEGRIPTAYRNGRTIRFRLEDVRESLKGKVSAPKDDRYVEIVVMALSLVCGPVFPRIRGIDLGSITMDEVQQIKQLCAVYEADLREHTSAEAQVAYCEGVIEGARRARDRALR